MLTLATLLTAPPPVYLPVPHREFNIVSYTLLLSLIEFTAKHRTG
jgi:hypothetical protein